MLLADALSCYTTLASADCTRHCHMSSRPIQPKLPFTVLLNEQIDWRILEKMAKKMVGDIYRLKSLTFNESFSNFFTFGGK